METSQPTTTQTTTAKPSSFSLGSVSFLAAILLFLMPFLNIKCGDTVIRGVKGYELATGFKVEDKKMNSSLFGNTETDQSSKSEKRDPDKFALAALVLGVIGLIVSFKAKGPSVLAALTGVLAAVGLIVSMINIKGDPKLQSASDSKNSLGDLGMGLNDNVIHVEFTAWFYIAIILFLLAAFLNWRKKAAGT